jgi:hypothetical protein
MENSHGKKEDAMVFRSVLDEVLEGWWDVRNGLIDEVRTIPANRFDFRPTP